MNPLRLTLLSHLASADAPTGAERSLALLAKGLVGRGHHVSLVAPGPWVLAADVRQAGVEFLVEPTRMVWLAHHDPKPGIASLLKWAAARTGYSRHPGRIGSLLERLRPDVVHVNCLPHVAGAAAAHRAGLPAVWHVREILPAGRRRRMFAGWLASHATGIVAVSEAVAVWLRAEGLGDRVRVVHNGIVPAPDPAAAREPSRRLLGLPEAGVTVGLVGQLVPHKGALEFVAAATAALAREPSLRFLIAGAGPEGFRRRVRSAVGRAHPGGRIHLLPARPEADVLIGATDVICCASTAPDPLPRAILEGMAAGRSVVAFDAGGAREMIEHDATGLLVPPGDVAGLAEAFVRLARDPGRREVMGRRGAERARTTFSLDAHVEKMESLFTELAR